MTMQAENRATSGTMNSNHIDVLARVEYAASCGFRRGDEDLSALFAEAANEIRKLRKRESNDD